MRNLKVWFNVESILGPSYYANTRAMTNNLGEEAILVTRFAALDIFNDTMKIRLAMERKLNASRAPNRL